MGDMRRSKTIKDLRLPENRSNLRRDMESAATLAALGFGAASLLTTLVVRDRRARDVHRAGLARQLQRQRDDDELARLCAVWRKDLLTSVIPFWEKHSVDKEGGGFFTCLDRDGSLYDDRKYTWLQVGVTQRGPVRSGSDAAAAQLAVWLWLWLLLWLWLWLWLWLALPLPLRLTVWPSMPLSPPPLALPTTAPDCLHMLLRLLLPPRLPRPLAPGEASLYVRQAVLRDGRRR